MVSSNVVGGAASACLDSAARASAVASEAIVARKPDVARPVARMRPAAATCRLRLPIVDTLVCRSMIGMALVEFGSMTTLAAVAVAAALDAVAAGPAGGLHGIWEGECAAAEWVATGGVAACWTFAAGATFAAGVAADAEGFRLPSLASRASCCSLSSVIGSSRLHYLPVEVACIRRASAELACPQANYAEPRGARLS